VLNNERERLRLLTLTAMASRSVVRRGTTTAHLSTQPNPSISVEDWEAKAPLGELETRSVSLIKTASERAPLPLKVAISTQLLPTTHLMHRSSAQRVLGLLDHPRQPNGIG
jgi:hypothetical protein